MRKTYEYGTTGSAVLDAPENTSARPKSAAVRRAVSDPLRPTRTLAEGYAEDPDTEAFLRASGRARRMRRGIIPRTRNGRIAAGVGALVVLLGTGFAALAAKHYLTTSEKFQIPSSAAIEIDGNTHLTRSQMLSVFGEDIERNIFKVPMHDRRAQLEVMPWVEHATVMRLLPNRIRVQVTERVPVAFVRQGGTIGMVDATGVLLDIPPDAPGNPSYSFPVVTGLKADELPATRAQRMKLYTAFLKDLDSDGKAASAQLSEIDLSDIEDVKALVPDHNNEVLVHFGTEGFLARYKKFEDHIGEWRQQYPRLGSVDMRYERQVVLQMPAKDSTVVGGAQPSPTLEATAATPAPAKPEAKATPKFVAAAKPVATAKPAVAPAPKLVAAATTPKPAAPKPTSLAPKPATTAAVTTKPETPAASKPAPHAVETATKKAPAPHAAAAKNAKLTAKEAATQKRVEAIRAWMAKRHDAQAAKGSAAGNPTSASPGASAGITTNVAASKADTKLAAAKYHPTQVAQ